MKARPAVISVMVAVPDAPKAVAWYSRALGAVELWNLGSVAGLEIAGAPIFVGEPANHGWESPTRLGSTSARIEVFCDDPDGFIARAVEAGAEGSVDEIYPSFLPKTDSDGNDIAGVRLPDVTVPLATYTGWALRSGPQANDGCEQAGQYIPFARTEAERLSSGDPRPSVEERYRSFGQYYSEVIRAIDGLVKDR